MAVVLPLPLGPSRPKNLTLLYMQIESIERQHLAIALHQTIDCHNIHSASLPRVSHFGTGSKRYLLLHLETDFRATSCTSAMYPTARRTSMRENLVPIPAPIMKNMRTLHQ